VGSCNISDINLKSVSYDSETTTALGWHPEGAVCPGACALFSLIYEPRERRDLLSSWTAIFPNVPSSFKTLLGSHSADLWACDTLVVPIVPLPNVFGNLDFGIALKTAPKGIAMRLPWQWAGYAKIEQFKGALCSLSWGNVTE
jgi:hypothetical protein